MHLLFRYYQGILTARHFWWHLALSDLRSRWRRSFFGIFWSIIQPLGLTILIALVFSRIFKQNVTDYAPYILSGMIVWDYVSATVVGGSLAFVQADAYIKQTQHPLAIYTLRSAIAGLVVLMLASTALVGWVLIAKPQNFGWPWLAALMVLPVLGLIAWPWATIMAYLATRFRDVPPALGLILQAVWFVSPIYFEDSVFRSGGLSVLVDYNPIYHILELVRAPVLRGDWPILANWYWCAGTIVAFIVVATIVGSRLERRTIFYL